MCIKYDIAYSVLQMKGIHQTHGKITIKTELFVLYVGHFFLINTSRFYPLCTASEFADPYSWFDHNLFVC